jgi:5-hydroxyisourate hydrolase
MAILTSHFLNGTDGTHAGDVGVTLVRINADDQRTKLLESRSGSDGRFRLELDIAADAPATRYELVIDSGTYFAGRGIPQAGMTIMREIVLRFEMPDPSAQYHMPVIISPNNYSTWWSS